MKEYVHEVVINWLVLTWSGLSSAKRFRFSTYDICEVKEYVHPDFVRTQCEDDSEQNQDVSDTRRHLRSSNSDDFLADNLYNEILDSYIRDYSTNSETTISFEEDLQYDTFVAFAKRLGSEELVDDNLKVPSAVDTTSRSPYTSPMDVDDESSPDQSLTSIPSTAPSSAPTSLLSSTPESDPYHEDLLEEHKHEDDFDDSFSEEYGDVITTSWCADSQNHKDVCNGTIKDCSRAGMDHCQKIGDACLGVMVHPSGWTKQFKGFKTCKSATMEEKSDWLTRLKTQQPSDMEQTEELDRLGSSPSLSPNTSATTISPSSLPTTSPSSAPSSSGYNGPAISPSTQPGMTPTPAPRTFFDATFCESLDMNDCAFCKEGSVASFYCGHLCSESSESDCLDSEHDSPDYYSQFCEYYCGNNELESHRDWSEICEYECGNGELDDVDWVQNWSEWCEHHDDCGDPELGEVDCPFAFITPLAICFCILVHNYRNCTRVEEVVEEAQPEELPFQSPHQTQEAAEKLDTPKETEEKQNDDWEVIQQREMSDQDDYVMVD